MEFCDECGTLMRPLKNENKITMICPNCKKEKDTNTNQKIVSKIQHTPLDEIPVFDEKNSTLPTVEMSCRKCNNKILYWWTRQTRSSDEPETRFYKCTKCGFIWREYS